MVARDLCKRLGWKLAPRKAPQIWRFVSGLDLAHGLLFVLLAILIVDMFVPITSSLWFAFFCVIFGINLGLGCLRQIVKLIRGRKRPSLFRGGVLIFHLSLLILIAGGWVSKTMRFEGYFEEGEGQWFTHAPAAYTRWERGSLAQDKNRRFAIRLLKVSTDAAGKSPADGYYQSELELSTAPGQRGRKVTLRRGEPVAYAGVEILQSKNQGPALLLRLRRPQAPESIGYVNLQRPKIKGGSSPEKSFPLPFADTQATVRLLSGGSKPLIKLTLRRAGKILLESECKVGGSVILPGDDGALDFLAVNQWSGILVVHDPGLTFMYIGFGGIMLGLVGMYLRPAGAVSPVSETARQVLGKSEVDALVSLNIIGSQQG